MNKNTMMLLLGVGAFLLLSKKNENSNKVTYDPSTNSAYYADGRRVSNTDMDRINQIVDASQDFLSNIFA